MYVSSLLPILCQVPEPPSIITFCHTCLPPFCFPGLPFFLGGKEKWGHRFPVKAGHRNQRNKTVYVCPWLRLEGIPEAPALALSGPSVWEAPLPDGQARNDYGDGGRGPCSGANPSFYRRGKWTPGGVATCLTSQSWLGPQRGLLEPRLWAFPAGHCAWSGVASWTHPTWPPASAFQPQPANWGALERAGG